jgi:hypothetical protein
MECARHRGWLVLVAIAVATALPIFTFVAGGALVLAGVVVLER